MSPRTRSLLQVHAAVLLFGFAGVLGKLLPDLAPHVIVFGRVLFASVALGIVTALRRLPAWPRSGRSLLAFAALGAILAAHWTTFFLSVQESSVAVALVTFSTFPIFVALLEPLLFWEPLRPTDLVLAALALAGILILAPSYELGDRATQGALWGVASGFTFAVLALLNRRYVREHSSITLTLYQDGFAAVALLPFVIAARPVITPRDLLLLLVLGILCTAVGHALFTAGLRSVNARTASMIACLEPVYGTGLALLIREIPSARTLVGGAIVLGVALYATLHAHREGPAGDAPM
jgi:drug/metabolite transporter (DMT)-like permease